MIDQLLVPAMIITGLSGGLIVLAHEIGAFLYDVGAAKRARFERRHPYARRFRERPLVTVLVSAHNNALAIERCLDSVVKNTYHKLEILVVDHASQDATGHVVRRYIAMHPKQHIRLVARRVDAGQAAANKQAFRRHGRGQLVMTLPAASYCGKSTLKRAGRHFANDPELDVLKPNEHIDSRFQITGLFEKYQALLRPRSDKFLSVGGFGLSVGDAACYRAGAFLKVYGRTGRRASAVPPLKIRYAHDAVITTSAQSSFTALLAHSYSKRVQSLQTVIPLSRRGSLADLSKLSACLQASYALCSAIISITGPLLIAYFLYLALSLHEPTLLLLVIGILSAFLLLSIWEDRQLRLRQKAAYAFGIPITYGLFYILALSRLLATVCAVMPSRAVVFRHQ